MTNKTELVSTNQTEGQAIAIDSREVADMVNVRHTDLMRKINGYVETLENAKLRSQDFFIKDTYKVNGNNKTYDCYLLTRKGCDMVANKMTGEKGILFTAAYVTKFEAMEKELTMSKYKLPTSFKEALLMLVEAEEEKEKLIAENNEKEAKLLIQAPKVDLYEDFMATGHIYCVNDIAKTLAIKGLGRNKLYEWLRWNAILIDTNEAYQRFINSGYVVHRNVNYVVPVYEWIEGKKLNKGFEPKTEKKVYFTAKGVEWLYKKLKKDGKVTDKTINVVLTELNNMKKDN